MNTRKFQLNQTQLIYLKTYELTKDQFELDTKNATMKISGIALGIGQLYRLKSGSTRIIS